MSRRRNANKIGVILSHAQFYLLDEEIDLDEHGFDVEKRAKDVVLLAPEIAWREAVYVYAEILNNRDGVLKAAWAALKKISEAVLEWRQS